MPALNEMILPLGISDEIAGVALHQVRLEPEPGFTRAGAADDQYVFVSCRPGVLRAVVHGESLGSCEDDVVLKTGSTNPECAFLRKESHHEMITNMTYLNPSYSDVLSLKVAFEYSDLEIAQLLGITPSNVRVRLHRARHSLGLVLEKEEF